MVRQAALWQVVAVAVVAVLVAFSARSGGQAGAGVAAGGAAVILGSLLASRVTLAADAASANVVLMRWFLGIILRWTVFLAVMVGAAAVWKLPPLALLFGVLAALVAHMLSVSFQTFRKT